MSAGQDIAPGIEFSTFSIIGRCKRTGMFGIAIATSEMAVGSRCIHVAPGVGAVICQASTNPRLGFLGLNLLRAGWSAPRVVDELARNDQWVERRQLGCLDVRGLAAGRTGSGNREWAGHRAAPDVVVAANAVVGPGVVEAMHEAFMRTAGRALWERLLDALEAGKRPVGSRTARSRAVSTWSIASRMRWWTCAWTCMRSPWPSCAAWPTSISR
jgi:uncharacterized Ntn-hydrolase superfamily protein